MRGVCQQFCSTGQSGPDGTVGAGLLANPLELSLRQRLDHRIRQQAGSHSDIPYIQWDRLQRGRGCGSAVNLAACHLTSSRLKPVLQWGFRQSHGMRTVSW